MVEHFDEDGQMTCARSIRSTTPDIADLRHARRRPPQFAYDLLLPLFRGVPQKPVDLYGILQGSVVNHYAKAPESNGAVVVL